MMTVSADRTGAGGLLRRAWVPTAPAAAGMAVAGGSQGETGGRGQGLADEVAPGVRCSPKGGGGRAAWYAAGLLGLALLMSLVGCASKEKIHPALRVEGEELERAVRRGESLAKRGADPYEAFIRGSVNVNKRLSPGVILWSAGVCWPAEQISFQIARSGATTDAEIRRATRGALKLVENELRCTATIQIPKSRDPAGVEFLLRTNSGVEYPPVAVETPVYLRDTVSVLDPTAPASGVYYYVVRFPIRGGPGVPAIGPQVRSLFLVISDGIGQAPVEFRMPRVEPR